jgi:hypothetical protein
MTRREHVEKRLIEGWLIYDRSVAAENKRAVVEYRLEICLNVALLLNTYLDADESIDWCGTWADRLLDEEIASELSGVRRISGLMVCSKLGVGYMHITPFRAVFLCSSDFIFLRSYELFFAAEGPWKRVGTPLVVPFTKDQKVRQELKNSMGPEDNWGTVYRKS